MAVAGHCLCGDLDRYSNQGTLWVLKTKGLWSFGPCWLHSSFGTSMFHQRSIYVSSRHSSRRDQAKQVQGRIARSWATRRPNPVIHALSISGGDMSTALNRLFYQHNVTKQAQPESGKRNTNGIQGNRCRRTWCDRTLHC